MNIFSLFGFNTDEEKQTLYEEIYKRDINAQISEIVLIYEKLKITIKEIYTNLTKFDVNNASQIYKMLYNIDFYASKTTEDGKHIEIPEIDLDYVGEHPCIDALLCKLASTLKLILILVRISNKFKKHPDLIDDIYGRFKLISEVSDRLNKYVMSAIIQNQVNENN